jgi:hypothetical protein
LRAALLSAAWIVSGCLPIDPPDGVLVCGQPPDECPPGYACAADHTCRRPIVMNPPDLGAGSDGDVNQPTDMRRPPADLTPPPPPADLAIVCPAGAFMCDDFETGDLNRWSGTFLGPPHPSKILKDDTGQSHSPTHALHAAVDSSTEDSFLYVGSTYATPKSAPLALRMWVKPLKALNNSGMITRLFNIQNTFGFQIGGDVNGNWFIAQDLGTSPFGNSSIPIGINQWTCVELVITGSAVQLFLDDSVSPAIDMVPKNPTAYTDLHVGVEWAPKGVPVDVWIDDVAFGTSRLHCSN